MNSNPESTGNVITNFSIRQLIIVTLLSWLSQIGFDLFQGAGLFARLWLESRGAFLPPEKMFQLIPLGYLSFLISSSMLVWLMVGLGISGWRNGALFGLKIGSFLSFAMVLGMASAFPIKAVLLAAWLFGGIVQNSIAAMVIGSGLSGGSSWPFNNKSNRFCHNFGNCSHNYAKSGNGSGNGIRKIARDSLVTCSFRSFSLKFRSYFFNFAPNTEQVSAPYFTNIFLTVAPAQKFCRDIYRLCGIVEAFYSASAVKIAAQAHMVYPDKLDRMVDMIDQVSDIRRGR